jgi:hypothetical protein
MKICAEIMPFSKTLVDSFDIPDHLLGMIAGDWIRAHDFDHPNPSEHIWFGYIYLDSK